MSAIRLVRMGFEGSKSVLEVTLIKRIHGGGGGNVGKSCAMKMFKVHLSSYLKPFNELKATN